VRKGLRQSFIFLPRIRTLLQATVPLPQTRLESGNYPAENMNRPRHDRAQTEQDADIPGGGQKPDFFENQTSYFAMRVAVWTRHEDLLEKTVPL
jgi:hypothetical protein